MTWNQYHQTVARALNAPAPDLVHIPTDTLVKIAPERAGICLDNFQFNNIFDKSASHRDFGFAYTIPFETGVRRIASWLDDHGKMLNSDDDPYDDGIINAWRKVPAFVSSSLGK
jgi:nucleoside-diphosphate-sugar epimerase